MVKKSIGFLAVICAIGLSVVAFAWYKFRSPLAHHVTLSPTVQVADYNLPLQTHFFTTVDNLKLAGYSAQQPAGTPSKGWIILVHGYTPNGWKSMLGVGSFLYQEGYDIFMPSLRSYGESEGSYVALGTQEWQDVLAADELVRAELNPKKLPVGWYGVSMGAASALVAAGQAQQPPDFLIAQVPYASVTSLLAQQIREEKLPAWLFMPLAYVIPQLEFGWQYHEHIPLNNLAKITMPLLVIGAQRDNQVLFEDSALIFKEVSTPVEQKTYIELNTGHDPYGERPEEVQGSVTTFLSAYDASD